MQYSANYAQWISLLALEKNNFRVNALPLTDYKSGSPSSPCTYLCIPSVLCQFQFIFISNAMCLVDRCTARIDYGNVEIGCFFVSFTVSTYFDFSLGRGKLLCAASALIQANSIHRQTACSFQREMTPPCHCSCFASSFFLVFLLLCTCLYPYFWYLEIVVRERKLFHRSWEYFSSFINLLLL